MITIIQCICFLASFLLFQIELIIAKIFLPVFGGSYLVWGACLVFFQAVLLAGYGYMRWIGNRYNFQRYRYIHFILMLLPLCSFPGKMIPARFILPEIPLVVNIFWQLFLTIGIVFFILSTLSVYWQIMLSRSLLKEKSNPYVLFAASNAGALLGLLSYPVFFELHFDLNEQQMIWRSLYLLLLLSQGVSLFLLHISTETAHEKPITTYIGKIPSLLFAAASVIIFMTTTNILSEEIAPMPLLWIIPLGIYLLSFILNFKRTPFCPSWIIHQYHYIFGFSLLLYFLVISDQFPTMFKLVLLVAVTFLHCMFCQFKLFQLRPQDHRQLGSYYFLISLGSFLGGFIITWIIPLVSTSFIEYFLGLLLISLVLYWNDPTRLNWKSAIVLICFFNYLYKWPHLFPDYGLRQMSLLILLTLFVFYLLNKQKIALLLCTVMILSFLPQLENVWKAFPSIYKHRNYYGIYEISDIGNIRWLAHSKTLHGAQFLIEKYKPTPLTYYGEHSPIGNILKSDRFDFKKIAIFGLGNGTLATYFKNNQEIDIYEIDPDIINIANEYFTFLSNSVGKINIKIGDARIKINEITEPKYDLIIADAFSGDSIPTHLLTQEAIETYRKKLKDNGIILFHITNRYVDLHLPLCKTGKTVDALVAYKNDNVNFVLTSNTRWLSLTWNQDAHAALINDFEWKSAQKKDLISTKPWTDRYSSLIPYLDIRRAIRSIREFNFLKM